MLKSWRSRPTTRLCLSRSNSSFCKLPMRLGSLWKKWSVQSCSASFKRIADRAPRHPRAALPEEMQGGRARKGAPWRQEERASCKPTAQAGRRAGLPPFCTDEEMTQALEMPPARSLCRALVTRRKCGAPSRSRCASTRTLKALVFPRLAKASKTAIFRILDDLGIKPHKIEYYCERRDMRI